MDHKLVDSVVEHWNTPHGVTPLPNVSKDSLAGGHPQGGSPSGRASGRKILHQN
jgi:hypothetical protein